MKLPKPFSWTRAEARSGAFDGKFLIGVRTTGIYCLPSCPTHWPRRENVTLFRTEAECAAASLRACKRCRPDLYYRGENEDAALFAGLAARVRAAPADFANTRALAKTAGVGLSKLAQLTRDLAGLSPAAWLRQERVLAAQLLLRDTGLRVADIALAVGFASESAFHRHFTALACLPPARWRAEQRRAA